MHAQRRKLFLSPRGDLCSVKAKSQRLWQFLAIVRNLVCGVIIFLMMVVMRSQQTGEQKVIDGVLRKVGCDEKR